MQGQQLLTALRAKSNELREEAQHCVKEMNNILKQNDGYRDRRYTEVADKEARVTARAWGINYAISLIESD